MKYMGSKNRIAKFILPFLLEDYTYGMTFIDACVGGANVIDKIPAHIPRYANDNNKYLIAMFKSLQNGVDLDSYAGDISKDVYDVARDYYNNGLSDEHFTEDVIGWIGFMASANGRFFEGGYSGISETKIGTKRNYIDESVRGIKKQIPFLKDIIFSCQNVTDINPVSKSIIYADIPYKGTKQYSKQKFNYDSFYDWCRKMSADGHIVYVSEYEMPSDFKCVWKQEVKSSLSANGKSGGLKMSIEKLFKL